MTWRGRLVWGIVGLILLVVGVGGILINRGRLNSIAKSNATLMANNAGEQWRSWGFWAPLVAIVVGVIVLVLGVLLLRAQFRRPKMSWPGEAPVANLDTDTGTGDGRPGVTRVATSTLVEALERDLRRDPGIEEVSAALGGRPENATLKLRLALRPGATVAGADSAVRTALDRFAATSGVRPNLADVEVTTTSARPRREARVA